jgi:hypothetical protein
MLSSASLCERDLEVEMALFGLLLVRVWSVHDRLSYEMDL